MVEMSTRLRRLRGNALLRDLVSEHALSITDLVLPLFIKSGSDIRNPIPSLPGHCQWSVDRLPEMMAVVEDAGISAVMLFGLPAYKDALGSASWQLDGVIQQAVKVIKARCSDILVIADCCLCEYTEHGHCGVLRDTEALCVDNDETLPLLARQAVSLAEAGADVIAPSGMMDGMVGAIRSALDAAGFVHIPILSYAVKYASALYGPFREAADGAPVRGDRKTYQMDFANVEEALREAQQDVAEGADMLMVKPAQWYLDVITRVRHSVPGVPLAAYQVSGEYAMIKAAAQQGWIDEEKAMMESLLSIKRSGARFVISYFALSAAKQLRGLS